MLYEVITKLIGQQPLGKPFLQDRIRTCRPAAQMRVRHRRELETELAEHPLDDAVELLSMLQGARRLKSDTASAARQRRKIGTGQDLADVTRHHCHACRFLGIARISYNFV